MLDGGHAVDAVLPLADLLDDGEGGPCGRLDGVADAQLVRAGLNDGEEAALFLFPRRAGGKREAGGAAGQADAVARLRGGGHIEAAGAERVGAAQRRSQALHRQKKSNIAIYNSKTDCKLTKK